MKKEADALAFGWNGETREAAIPEVHLTATGASNQEALIKALQAMDRLTALADAKMHRCIVNSKGRF